MEVNEVNDVIGRSKQGYLVIAGQPIRDICKTSK